MTTIEQRLASRLQALGNPKPIDGRSALIDTFLTETEMVQFAEKRLQSGFEILALGKTSHRVQVNSVVKDDGEYEELNDFEDNTRSFVIISWSKTS